MADNVEVKLSGDFSEATSGAKDAASSIASSLDGIKKALEDFTSAAKRNNEQTRRANADLSRSFLELKASATGGFNAIVGVIERFRGVLGSLAAALAGGFLFTKSVEEMLKFEDSVRGLSIVFGMTAEKATSMSVALRLAGISSETFESMAFKVGRTLKTNSEEFDRLGVVTRTATGQLLPMDQILQNVYRRMLDFKQGTDQNLFALTAVGRSAKDFSSDMERLASVTERAASVQAKLGIEMGPAQIAAIEKYRVDLNEFRLVLETIGEKIGAEVLPRLESMAVWFNEYGPSAIKVIIDIVKGFITVLQVLGTSIATMAIRATGAFNAMVVSARVVGAVLKAQVTGDWAGVVDAVTEANGKIAKINADTAKEVEFAWQQSINKVKGLWSEAANPEYWGGEGKRGMKAPVTGKGNESFTNKPTGGGSDERLAQFKSELDDMNLANGAFLQLSKQNEVEFWEEKLALVKGYGKQDVTLRQEINREILRASNAAAKEDLAADVAALHEKETEDKKNKDAQIADAVALSSLMKQIYGENSAEFKNALKEETAIREQWTAKEEELAKRLADIKMRSDEQTAKYNIEMNKMADDQAVAMGQMSNAQRIAQERSFVQQEYKIDLDGINARLAAEKEGTAEYAKLIAEKLSLEQNFQKQLTALSNAAELERTQDARAAAQDIQNSLGTLIDNLVSRTQSLSKSWQDFVKQLSGSLTSLASNAFMKQIMGPGTAGGDFLGKLTGGVFGGGSASAATTANTTAVGSLTMAVEANTAALGGSAVGAAGGAAGGSFGGIFGDLIPSFDVGSPYIPQDTLAVVHKGEKIIPAKYNNGGASFGVRNQFMINGPIDTRTMQQISHASEKAQRKASIRLNK